MHRALVCTSLVVSVTCASSTQTGEPRPSRSVITADQVAAEDLQGATAWEVVERFHSDWLLGSPPTSPNDPPRLYPVIYVDDIRMGDLETLRTVPGGDIRDIRLIAPRDAIFRYGVGHDGGIIAIRTKLKH